MSVVEAELAFFEVKIKRLLMDSTKLRKTYLGQTPEVFNAVDVGYPSSKFILSMIHTIVLSVPKINQAIVTAPSI